MIYPGNYFGRTWTLRIILRKKNTNTSPEFSGEFVSGEGDGAPFPATMSPIAFETQIPADEMRGI